MDIHETNAVAIEWRWTANTATAHYEGVALPVTVALRYNVDNDDRLRAVYVVRAGYDNEVWYDRAAAFTRAADICSRAI